METLNIPSTLPSQYMSSALAFITSDCPGSPPGRKATRTLSTMAPKKPPYSRAASHDYGNRATLCTNPSYFTEEEEEDRTYLEDEDYVEDV